MNERLAKLRKETIKIKQNVPSDFIQTQDSATFDSRSNSKNSDSQASSPTTKASRLVTDESSHGGQHQNS
jgi:hypothetical protein